MTENRRVYRLPHIDRKCYIEEIGADQAMRVYKGLPKHYVGFSQLFDPDRSRQQTEANNEEALRGSAGEPKEIILNKKPPKTTKKAW
jgi:hypothetical protein